MTTASPRPDQKKNPKPKPKRKTLAPANGGRNSIAQERDLELISKWRIQGKSLAAIGQLLASVHGRPKPYDHSVIGTAMRKIEERWKAAATANHDAYIRQEVAKLDLQEAELWEAWEKSKQDTTTQSIATTEDDDAPPDEKKEPEKRGRGRPPLKTKKTLAKKTGHGNSAYMQLILQVQQRRAKLLGLDAPDKAPTAPDGTPIVPQTHQMPAVNIIIAAPTPPTT